jgi:uncharacterized membrane protein required for colicin V production
MQVPAFAGVVIDIIAVLILIFSFVGGLRQGAPKEFFGLLGFIVTLLLSGFFVSYINVWLAFVPDGLWRAFLTLLLTMSIILIVINIVLLLPRNLLDSVWNGGFIWSALGGVLGVINTALGFALVMVILNLYPVMPWLNAWLASSQVLNWVSSTFGQTVLVLLHANPA